MSITKPTSLQRRNAVYVAAEELYKKEIIDTEMINLYIASGFSADDYKAQWILDKVHEWLEEAILEQD